MEFNRIAKENIEELAKLMLEMWPDSSIEAELRDCKRILESERETCFLAVSEEQFVGFIYLAIRTDYVEGATSSPVAYLEGIYVKPEFQRTGVGEKLLEYGEDWSKENGFVELASDSEVENSNSIRFHKKAGFEEKNRVVCFVKRLDNGQ